MGVRSRKEEIEPLNIYAVHRFLFHLLISIFLISSPPCFLAVELHDLKKNYQIEMIGHKDALTKIADLERASQEQIQVRDGDMQDMESEITRLRDELEFAVEQNTQLRQSLSSSEENVSKKSEEIDRLARALESKSVEVYAFFSLPPSFCFGSLLDKFLMYRFSPP